MCFDIHLTSAQRIYTNESCASRAGVQISGDQDRQTWSLELCMVSVRVAEPRHRQVWVQVGGPHCAVSPAFQDGVWAPAPSTLDSWIPTTVSFSSLPKACPVPYLPWAHSHSLLGSGSSPPVDSRGSLFIGNQLLVSMWYREKVDSSLCGNHGSPRFQPLSPVQFFYMYLWPLQWEQLLLA